MEKLPRQTSLIERLSPSMHFLYAFFILLSFQKTRCMPTADHKILRKSKPNYLYSIIGVALVLFLLGFFGLVLLQGQQLLRSYQESVNILIEFKENTSSNQIASLTQLLESATYVKVGTVQFTSKEEAVKSLEKDFGEELKALGFSNPLYDVINFNTKANYLHADSLMGIKAQLKTHPFVNDVFYQEGIVENIAKNIEKVSYLSLIIGILFIFVAITLIHNTIKLALYANRFLIKNMQLIGASWGFISRPYLYRSIKNGLWSAMIALLLLLGLILFVSGDLADFGALKLSRDLLGLSAALIVLGVLITTLSTYYIVNKYLRMRVDDLY